MEPITVRRMRFAFPPDLDSVFIAGEPEESYANIALSLLLPHLEPYLIRTMRAARAQVSDPHLALDLDRFVAQEGQHYRQHLEFNALFRDRCFDGIAALEAELAADYQRFTRTKSLRFNLAYAEGFEAFTTAMALVFVDEDKSKWEPAALDLFLWHLVEELEHRTVAFDVYAEVFGDYLYRLVVGFYAQWHLFRFLLRASKSMLDSDPRVASELGGVEGRTRRMPRLRRMLVEKLLPRVLRTYSPFYTPHDIAMPASMKEVAERFTRAALEATG